MSDINENEEKEIVITKNAFIQIMNNNNKNILNKINSSIDSLSLEEADEIITAIHAKFSR